MGIRYTRWLKTKLTPYPVFLETDNKGHWMAHVMDLPGCTVRATTKKTALSKLPHAIRAYRSWLCEHGEAVSGLDEPIQAEIAEESGGIGPFDPGDTAALFLPDRRALSLEDMESLIRRMGYSRSDLMGLVTPLTGEMLDWQVSANSFSIRRILRHVGNAEEWYISRILPAEKLPTEWQNDDQLPILEFLEMERRTAVACIRAWTEEERSGLFYPTTWAQNPGEAWTARKVLRRFLEHEREHTAQVQGIISKKNL